MATQDPVLEELKKISKILILAHGESIEREISKVATSDERKKIWVLIDGTKMSKDIAKEVGVAVRSVNRFLAIATKAGLVDNPWGKPPKRVIDYVPPSWVQLIKFPEEEKEAVEQSGMHEREG